MILVRRALGAATVLLLVLGIVPAVQAAPARPVYVLDQGDGLAPSGAPTGSSPAAFEALLRAEGVKATRVSGDALPEAAQVIVNPYGAAFPATAAVERALAAGAGWVNLGGLPFSRPDGQTDGSAAERHGVRAGAVPSVVVTGTEPTQLGRALLPAWRAAGHRSGLALHALDPVDERPLVQWVDAAFGPDGDGDGRADDGGVSAGPAVVLVVAPVRIVAAGFDAASSPLAPSAPGSGALLADLVRAAAPADHIDTVTLTRSGPSLRVDATATGGRLEGVGTLPAPAPWTPQRPVTERATVRLRQGHRLVDLVSLASNPAVVRPDGDALTLNGDRYVMTGMASGASTPRGLDAAGQARMLRNDLMRMHEVGVTSYRLYGGASDWLWNAAADSGLLLAPSVGLGWIFGDSEAAANANRANARAIGRDARGRHNVLMLGVGNEFMDPDHERLRRAITLLAGEVRTANGEGALVTYGASHDEPWLLGPLPVLDVYSVNCYGASYPYGYPEPGFAHCVAHAKQLAAVGQPLVLGEWGANTWQIDAANMTLRDRAGVFVRELELARAEFVREKWFTMMQLGAVGGFAFQWADGIDKCLFTSAHCDATDPVVVPGDDSGYRPLNHEKYWGFHDVWRNPRLALTALEDIYVRSNNAPTGLLP